MSGKHTVQVYSVAATIGYYGPQMIKVAFDANRGTAINKVLDKIIDQCQPGDKARVEQDRERILEYLQYHERWNGGNSDGDSVSDEYLHVVVEETDLTINYK